MYVNNAALTTLLNCSLWADSKEIKVKRQVILLVSCLPLTISSYSRREASFSASVVWVSDSILLEYLSTILLLKQLKTVKRQKQSKIMAKIKEKNPTIAITIARSKFCKFSIDNSVYCQIIPCDKLGSKLPFASIHRSIWSYQAKKNWEDCLHHDVLVFSKLL